ncbi:hypothetical protein [Secundilactobacillus malefermentans]|uniref:Uncharacterized protein n=1 Tax=Secundilactobacillus malefermentans TaxID=176292 RepID=A0A4R5NKD2_9LACO|nr:hypothetical protein [Secundilactobacillus malefermentans]KRM58726.1 hypothetical protein FD44_GL000347 [Secundilactobacillus malefermentans DSM 5705 = KCTC 3548]TDG75057.1 hypothetical protein C5L31_001687 [Secundilactobacillus malefermentans]
MDNLDWLLNESQMMAEKSQKFDEKALFIAVQDTAKELSQRINQVSGEIDGRTWDTGNW